MFRNTNSDPTLLYYLWANLFGDPMMWLPRQTEGDIMSGLHRRMSRSAAKAPNQVSEKVYAKNEFIACW